MSQRQKYDYNSKSDAGKQSKMNDTNSELPKPTPVTSDQVLVQVKDHPNNKFLVFVEPNNTDDMTLIGAFYSSTKKVMLVSYQPFASEITTSNLWMFPFESLECFKTLFEKVKETYKSINMNNYKIWTMYALVNTLDVDDKKRSTFLKGYFWGCDPLIDYEDGIVSFGSEEDMNRAKGTETSIESFKDTSLSGHSLEFKIEGTKDVKMAALERFKAFNPKTIALGYNPFSNSYTGDGIIYLPSEDSILDVKARYSSQCPMDKLAQIEAKYPFKVYFKNFDPSVGEEGIKKLFLSFGESVQDINVKGNIFGTAWFKNDSDRQKCISEFNKDLKYGKSAHIDYFKEKESSSSSSSCSSSSSSQTGPYKVYFSGFAPGTSKEEIINYFNGYEIDLELLKIKEDANGVTTGSGDVVFMNEQDMNDVIQKYNGKRIGSKFLRFERFDESKIHQSKKPLHILRSDDYYCAFVANMPTTSDMNTVEVSFVMNVFKSYEPLGVKVHKDGKYCVVFFMDKDHMNSAIRGLNKTKVNGQLIRVKVHDYMYKFNLELDSLPVDPSRIQKRIPNNDN